MSVNIHSESTAKTIPRLELFVVVDEKIVRIKETHRTNILSVAKEATCYQGKGENGEYLSQHAYI